jgi:hypothetical protein
MGELQGWLKAHEVSPEQTKMIEQAIGRIALRLGRESVAERDTDPAEPPALAAEGASPAR